jgi:hypothetical protein
MFIHAKTPHTVNVACRGLVLRLRVLYLPKAIRFIAKIRKLERPLVGSAVPLRIIPRARTPPANENAL